MLDLIRPAAVTQVVKTLAHRMAHPGNSDKEVKSGTDSSSSVRYSVP